jgi:parallel beta-helix repeat protein
VIVGSRTLLALLLAAALFGVLGALLSARSDALAGPTTFYVNPGGSDQNRGLSPNAPFGTIQKAVDLARPGDVIILAPGEYYQDIVSRRDGIAEAPITIKGPVNAIVKGSGNPRIFDIRHDNLTLDGFSLDGRVGDTPKIASYREKLLYAIGTAPQQGVNGLRVLHMTFKNGGGECLRLRYFAQHNEIAYSRFVGCGVHDFKFNAGKRNGEAIYIGTAPEQRGDGKNPTADVDHSNNNWIHHNSFDTQGNECVDIKEGASGNIVEYNSCTGQRDPKSGGFDVRGVNNVIRYNESYGNAGAGIRLGGDTPADGVDNAVYGNNVHDNRAGGIELKRKRQVSLCGNLVSNNHGGKLIGAKGRQFDPTAPCQSRP